MPRYAEPVDIAARFDINMIGQLITDDGQELSRAAVLVHPNLLVALDDASGRVEAALRHGDRHTIQDLTELIGNSLSHLKSIVCTIAMSRILRRKPGCFTDLLQQISAEAEEYLKQLTNGHDVFTLEANVAAGLIDDVGNGNSDSVSLLKQRNLLSDNMIGRMYPRRSQGF